MRQPFRANKGVGKTIYEEAAKKAAAPSPKGEKTDENVIDAEFEVKDAK